MRKHCLFAAGVLFTVASCEKRETAPTAAERQAAASAQVEANKAEAAKDRAEVAVDVAKDRADNAVDVAKEKADLAEDRAEATKDRAAELADKADLDRDRVDWKGPGDDWDDDWASFADGTDRTVDKGDYTIERAKDGTIVAWRKTQQVAGNAFAELKDAALVTQVKAKLAADEDTRAHAINVDAEDHTVHLRGKVKSAKEAAEAVRIALGTPGSDKVVSHLTWK
jgi:hypothetical protein